MASVRVGCFVLDADDIKEVEMIEQAVAILRKSVIEEKKRTEMIVQIEELIDDFVKQFGAITIKSAKEDKETGEIIPVSGIKIVEGRKVLCG